MPTESCMKTSRLILLWVMALACLLTWQAASIIDAISKLGK